MLPFRLKQYRQANITSPLSPKAVGKQWRSKGGLEHRMRVKVSAKEWEAGGSEGRRWGHCSNGHTCHAHRVPPVLRLTLTRLQKKETEMHQFEDNNEW